MYGDFYGYLRNPSPDVPMWTSGRIYHAPARGVPGTTGAHGYGVVLTPVSWKPKTKYLENCPEVVELYRAWTQYKQRWAALPQFLGFRRGSKANNLRKKMKNLEKRGRAAGQACMRNVKIEEAEFAAQEMADLESGTMLYDASTDPFTGEVIPLPGQPSPGMPPAITGYAPSTEEEEGPNVLLWAGLGAAGLLGLIFFLRRQD